MARMLGIDYGEKRIGVALSDESGKMAFPKYTLQNDARLLEKILQVAAELEVEEVVLGSSLNYNREPNLIMGDIKNLARLLKKGGLKVYFEEEFLTTSEAMRIQGETSNIDASAAALILKSFMERQQKSLG